jgi:hypothetical protein
MWTMTYLGKANNPITKHRRHFSLLPQTDLFVLAQESKAVVEGVPALP